jgi:alkaline phosphatase D
LRAPCKIVANQVMIMSLDTAPGISLNTDSWDGYAAERREIAEHLIARRIRDVAFVTGDIHTFFAGNVTRTGRQTTRGERGVLGNPSMATEFVGGSVMSPGIVDRVADTEAERRAAAAPADAAVLATNPQIAYSNQAYKGYGWLEADPQELRVEFRAVREHRQPNSAVFTLRRFRVGRGDPYVQDLGGPLL